MELEFLGYSKLENIITEYRKKIYVRKSKKIMIQDDKYLRKRRKAEFFPCKVQN